MKKNILSFLLVSAMVFSLNIPVGASENPFYSESTDNYAHVSNSPINTQFPEDFVAPNYIYTEEDLQAMRANGASSTQATTSGTYVASFSSLTNSQVETVISAIKQGKDIIRTTYNNKEVFAFTSGSKTIYIPSSQIYKLAQGTCGLSSFNSNLTNYACSGNTSKVYTYVFSSYPYSYNGYTVYRFSIGKLAGQSYYNSSNGLYFKIRFEDCLAFDVYPTFIFGAMTYAGDVKTAPTIKLSITNTGGNNKSLYMGGYELSGVGRSTNSTTIGKAITLGYKSSQILGTVASGGLSAGTVYSLFNDLVSLTKSSVNSGVHYTAEPECLSNSAKNIYCYTCSTVCPFLIGKESDYVILKIGLIGTPTTSTKYSITTSFRYEI